MFEAENTDRITFAENVLYTDLSLDLSFNEISVNNATIEITYFFQGGDIYKYPKALFKGNRMISVGFDQQVIKELKEEGVIGSLIIEKIVFSTTHDPFKLKIKSSHPFIIPKTIY